MTQGTKRIVEQYLVTFARLGDRAQLQAYRDMLTTIYERLGGLKVKGKSLEEAVAEKPLADLEERWGKGIFTGEKWVRLIYEGLD